MEKELEARLRIQDLEEGDEDDDKQNPFDLLPDELVVQIFSQLSLRCVLVSASPCCRRFRRLSLDPALWIELELDGGGGGEEVEADEEIVKRCSLLRHLTVTKRDDAELLSVLAMRTSPTCLQHLEIIYCPPMSPNFFRCLGRSESVKRLNLVGNGRFPADDGGGGDVISTHATCLSSLTHLSLFNCRGLTSAGLVAMAQHCSSILYLNTEEVAGLGEEATNKMLSRLGPQLKGLFIDGEGLDDGAFANLKKCEKLENLGITFAEGLGAAGMEAVSRLSKLTTLKLRRGKALAGEDFTKCFSLKKLSLLEKLDLSECAGLDDPGLSCIAENCPKLDALTLNWCWDVTDQGVSSVIRGCPLLETLELLGLVKLTSGPLSDDLHLRLPRLTWLDLQQCPNVDDETLAPLVEKQPRGLHLISYYGEVVCPQPKKGAGGEESKEEDQ